MINANFLTGAGAWVCLWIVIGAYNFERTERMIWSLGIGLIGFVMLFIMGVVFA